MIAFSSGKESAVEYDAGPVLDDGPQAPWIADVRDVPLRELAVDADGIAAAMADRFLEALDSPSRVQAMTFNSAI